MVSISTLVITGLLCLLGGVALGALMLSLWGPANRTREVEERLYRAEDELKKYQQDVTAHFAHTSELVNNLTQSYREVYEHLANSALKLTTPALSRQILESANSQLLGGEKTYVSEEHFEAPRDWAPKQGLGALSESYGLHEEDDHPAVDTPEPDATAENNTTAERT